MPTGYTAPVVDGEVFQARDFVSSCARAFGAFVHQREDSLKTPTAEPDLDIYSMKGLADARADLDVLKTWSADRIKSEHAAYVEQAEFKNRLAVIEWKRTKARLEFMLAQLEEWTPNEQAAPIKKYAIEQIIETIAFDCGDAPYTSTIEEDAQKWFDDKLTNAEELVEYYKDRFDKDLKGALDRKAYARAVLDSIAQIPRVPSYKYREAVDGVEE